ncbi:hypothetical protein GCM10009759_71190 [Kitasatospora saccharophila]|uniref:Uncharacterized protein n=2 Tax=Kitasatospora saccharophila TaxID=407973 RepID=A0ABP5JSU6_9ACTN
MELLIAMALAYALGGGVTAGRATAAQHTKTPKDPKPIDRTESGKKIAQGAINSVARVYTFTSGAREGWRKAWPETKAAISERRTKVKADRAARKAGAAAEAEIVDAEIVEDETVNTGGPTTPTAPSGADAEASARLAAAVAAAEAEAARLERERKERLARWEAEDRAREERAKAATPPVPPVPPKPERPPTVGTAPAPAPAPADTASAGAVPSPAPSPEGGPHLRVVKDDPATPAPGTGGGTTTTTPRSGMSNLPTMSALVTEVTGVDSLMQYLAQLSRWARMEKDDAAAAVTRLSDLRAKAEHAYNAAAAAKYDAKTLGELAAIVEKLTELKTSREEDLRTSDLAERNASQASANVWGRHGGIQEARNAADVDMAETSTYGD